MGEAHGLVESASPMLKDNKNAAFISQLHLFSKQSIGMTGMSVRDVVGELSALDKSH
jgi:hypothetical protein